MHRTPRFTTGDQVRHNGRPAQVAHVSHRRDDDGRITEVRYHLAYTDDHHPPHAMHLLGRVLQSR